MFIKFLVASVLVGTTCGFPKPENTPPVYNPSHNIPEPSYQKPVYNQIHEEVKRPYAFNYGVKDDYTGANYEHKEDSNGEVIQGSYMVYLPDGRIQRVTYTADHVNGFQAEVTYEGEATFPEYKPHEPAQYGAAPPHSIPYKPQHSAPQPVYAVPPRFPEEPSIPVAEENLHEFN